MRNLLAIFILSAFTVGPVSASLFHNHDSMIPEEFQSLRT